MAFVLIDIATEDQLLARANRGDKNAITQIYDSFFEPIYQFIRYRVEETKLAEDIAGEVFFCFIDKVGTRVGPQHSLRGWLFRVARVEIAKHYGRTNRLPVAELDDWSFSAPDADLETQFIHNLDITRIRQALHMLVADQQEVVILRFVEALSLQETAVIMDKNSGVVKSLQSRAVNTLRQILGEMRVSAE